MCASLWLKALCVEWSLLGLRSGLHHLEILTSVILPRWLCVWRQWSNRARPSEVHEREPVLHFCTFASFFLPDFWTGVPPTSCSTGPEKIYSCFSVDLWYCSRVTTEVIVWTGTPVKATRSVISNPRRSRYELELFLACCRALLSPAMGSWGKDFAFCILQK